MILEEQVRLTGVKNFTGKDKLIDYYIEQPGQDRIYAFIKIFTQNTYDMCKSGIRVNELSTKRSRDRGVMRLLAVVLLAIFTMPLVGGYVLVTGKDKGN